MRAMVCRAWGKPEDLRLEDVPAPEPGPGEVLIRVRASSVNYADTIMVGGTYQTKPPFPFSPGLDCAGEVLRCGEGATRVKPGDRVMAILNHGGFAEQAVARESETYVLPAGMSDAVAASFLTAYVSSDVALRWQANLQPGETLLVLGASGGVGLTAVEIGKAMGATVIAGASSPEKLAIAREHGADHLIDYAVENLKGRIEALTDGKGVDVCYDPVGGPLFDQALSSLGWGGRILLIGFVAGVPKIPANRLLVKHRSAMGSSLRWYRWNRPEQLRQSVEALLAWYLEGRLKPLVSQTLPLEQAAEAMRLLTGRVAVGKVVLTV